jgi:hypothetical protein
MSVDKWDQRQLCSDGACVGVIGPTGTCKVCGRAAPNWGEERKRGLVDSPELDDEPVDADSEPADADAAGAADATGPSTPAALRAPAGWSERQVCSDGACIGLIGANGKCKVCGRAAEGARIPIEVELDYVPEQDDEDDDDDPDDDEDRDETSEHHDDEDDASEDEEDYADDDEDADEDDDEDEDDDLEPDEAKQLAAAASELAPVALAESPDVERKLCPDGACVGVIGPHGRCKICGKAAE